MNAILPLARIPESNPKKVGGKAYALALAKQSGFRVPETVCLTTDIYDEFIDGSGLRERIQLELHRKPFEQMRWEEIWDCALRIRNRFLTAPLADSLEARLTEAVVSCFSDRAVVVRSSAPEEDTAAASFAGLHESVVNVTGPEAILEAVRQVWASLWSDAALLYRQGEILVCDAVDPNMTFVVPLAAGIVERRGGMLIHGAIIAREYGIPCVTGVADATALIRTGDRVTVDGYLGIVTVGDDSLIGGSG